MENRKHNLPIIQAIPNTHSRSTATFTRVARVCAIVAAFGFLPGSEVMAGSTSDGHMSAFVGYGGRVWLVYC